MSSKPEIRGDLGKVVQKMPESINIVQKYKNKIFMKVGLCSEA
jgi:hypothetical protein